MLLENLEVDVNIENKVWPNRVFVPAMCSLVCVEDVYVVEGINTTTVKMVNL
jgi:hypothetical protein